MKGLGRGSDAVIVMVGYLDSSSAAPCFTPGICSILNLYRRVFSFSFCRGLRGTCHLVFSVEVYGRQQLASQHEISPFV